MSGVSCQVFLRKKLGSIRQKVDGIIVPKAIIRSCIMVKGMRTARWCLGWGGGVLIFQVAFSFSSLLQE